MIRVGVTSLGAPHHAAIFANNMNLVLKHYKFEMLMPNEEYGWSEIDPKQLDVFWFYGFHALPDLLIDKFKAENPKLKVIVTWVGSDILEFAQFVTHRPKCAKCIIQGIDMHVADGLNLVNEMEKLSGIKPVYIPSIPDQSWQLTPLPETFSVAAYCPGFRADFFNYKLIQAAAAEMEDVEFHLFGGGPVNIAVDYMLTPNLSYNGWVEGEEKKKWWENSSILLYMPIHGSLGVTAIEFLQMGRRVICSKEYPHVHNLHFNSPQELQALLEKLKNIKEPDTAASEYYQVEFSREKQGEKVKQILDAI